MISEDLFYKLSGQVQGLELALKTLVAMQLASMVKDESGFAKGADYAETIAKHLREHAEAMLSQAPQGALNTGVPQILISEMGATAGRCFEQSAESLDQIAQLILAASEPASPAKN